MKHFPFMALLLTIFLAVGCNQAELERLKAMAEQQKKEVEKARTAEQNAQLRATKAIAESKTELAKQPTSFSGYGEYDKEAMDVEDFAAAFVRFKNGASLMLEVSWMLHHKLPEDKLEDMQVWLYGREAGLHWPNCCLLYTSPSPRDKRQSRMPSSA